MTEPIPDPDWTPPKWLTPFGKKELQQLAAAQHDRIQQLQIENRAIRARLAMYESREKAR